MDLRYLLLAGVWLGPVKPQISIILQPILDRIHTMHEVGMPLSTPDGPKCLKAKLLCCVFDLPARAMALNLTQWNGALYLIKILVRSYDLTRSLAGSCLVILLHARSYIT